MMDSLEEGEQLCTSAGVCNRTGQSRVLLQNEYLAAVNRILRTHLPTRFRLTDRRGQP
jgi:hypothetical protein